MHSWPLPCIQCYAQQNFDEPGGISFQQPAGGSMFMPARLSIVYELDCSGDDLPERRSRPGAHGVRLATANNSCHVNRVTGYSTNRSRSACRFESLFH
jgi:hypothetical protein